MTFGEKLKNMRIGAGLKQDDVAKGIGITSRSILAYEQGETLPKSNSTYEKLAEFFETSVEFWKEESDDDFEKAAEYAYGKKGKATAERLVNEVAGLFAGGSLSEEDTDKMMLALQDAYWKVKKKQAEDKEKAGNSGT
jgi:transcriptional regulator with XRE-family HTH domain